MAVSTLSHRSRRSAASRRMQGRARGFAPRRRRAAPTSVNAPRLAPVKLGEPEQFTFKGWNDETVYAYVVKPIDFDASRKYPIAFLVHGGPQGSFSNNFHYRWNAQTYTAAGYAAGMGDFHGSTGYGQGVTDSIGGGWGGKPPGGPHEGVRRAP